MMNRFAPILALSLLMPTLGATTVHAQASVTDGVIINADNMFRDVEKRQVRMTGHVQVVFKGQHLSCDKAQMDLQKQLITAEGNVIMSNEKIHSEGEKVIFNYKTNTGFLYNGFVQSGQVVFEGEMIEKVAESRYIATNGEYTACETCPPGWSFSGRKIDAEIGGYARIQRPVFHVAGVPILILPSLVVPLKSARESGFLVPTMGNSKLGGLDLSAVYFWAIDRSQDVTLTARWYQLRGYKALEDYRYVLSPDSRGRLQGALMQDTQLHNEGYTLPSNGPVDRWFLNYDHYYVLPDNFVHRANFKMVSDLLYTHDFPNEISGLGDPSLENKTSITKTEGNQYASAEVDVYINQLKSYPLQANDDAVNRFPELRHSITETRLGGDNGPLFHMDTDYVNFARQSYAWDDLTACQNGNPACYATVGSYQALAPLGQNVGPQGQIQRDGHFDRATDLWRTGQRLDLQPSLSYPFQIAHRFDILPSVTYRETQYLFNPTPEAEQTGPNGEPGFSPSAARRYVQGDVSARSQLSQVFGNFDDATGMRWKHSIEPELGYSQIPWMRQPNHPFFGHFTGLQPTRQYDPLQDSDLGNPNTGIQFDYEDRTYERRLAYFSLGNRITRKVWNDGTPDYRTLLNFQVGQSYDFKEAERQYGHPWSTVDALLDLRLDHFETYTTASYNGYAHHTNFTSRVKWYATPKNFIQLSYTDTFLWDNNYVITPGLETRTYGMGGGLVARYVEFTGNIDFSDVTHQVQDWSYGLNIRPPGRCWLIHLEQMQVFTGDRQSHASVSFDFGGETKVEAATRTQSIQ